MKLGDFGCAVKIKAHTTMPGELQVNDVVVILMITVKIKDHSIVPREVHCDVSAIIAYCYISLSSQGFVGTQAYMAPEVFTRNMHEGHGRAADIWWAIF